MPTPALPPRFPVIVGPTAGGKTDLAIEVAQHINTLFGRHAAEIVSADSMYVYRGLDIGAAKPTKDQQALVPHHLLDIVEPTERFSVHDWLTRAEATITNLRARGILPIVVGGTHLYAKALMEGLFEGPAADDHLRAALAAMPQADRRAELERIDAPAAVRIHPNDDRRTIRALEVFRLTGQSISSLQQQWDAQGPARTDRVLIGLLWPSEGINPRINARVKQMMEDGLFAEVHGLWSSGRLGPQAREALGYKQLVEHFEGRCSLEEAIEQIKIQTRHFAKSQRTWLKRLRSLPNSAWIDAADTPRDQWIHRVLRACGQSADQSN